MSNSRIRAIANALMRHAARMLPPSHADWREAMLGEYEQIADDRTAFHWAIGCAMAAYHERVMTMTTALETGVRWIGASLLGVHAVGTLLVVNLAIFLNLQSLSTLFAPGGGLDASALGQNYPAYLPPLLSAPFAAIALWAGAGVLYVIAAFRFLYAQSGFAAVLMAALLLDLFNVLVQSALPFASQTVYVGEWRLGMTIALLLPTFGLYLLLQPREA